jgi:ankyrin repeat protein
MLRTPEVNAKQWTPLHLASTKRHIDAMNALIASGAAVGAREEDQWMPLHLALQNGHVNDVKVVIASGAAVDAREEHNATPSHLQKIHWTS